MKKLVFLFSISFLLLLTHCEDKDKRLDEYENAPYVAFEKKPPNILGVKAIKDLVYEVTITASHVKKYQLDLTANLSGEMDTVRLGTFDAFPLNLKYTAADFAKALKKKVNDISFGDNFHFTGTATCYNGTVYYPDNPSYKRIIIKKGQHRKVDIPKDAMIKKEVTPEGDTIINIWQKKGMLHEGGYDPAHNYNQAYSFGFTIACPPDTYSKDGVAGTYIVNDDPDDSHDFIAGPKDNQFTIKSLFEEGKDVIVAIDPETYELTIDKQAVGTHPRYGTMYLEGKGMAFPCLDTYDMQLTLSVSAGYFFTDRGFTFKKKK